MSLHDFWTSVRTGMRLYAPGRVISDSPRLDAEAIRAALAKADLWLTPSVVRGYDPSDFPFLPPDERDELTRLVADFRAVASQVPPRKPATPAQVDAALPLFQRIVELLEFDRFADANAFRIGKTIEAEPAFPHEEVEDVRYRTSADQYGDPLLDILAYLPDSAMNVFLRRVPPVREAIQNLVFEHGQPYWPSVSCRLMGELATLPAIGEDG